MGFDQRAYCQQQSIHRHFAAEIGLVLSASFIIVSGGDAKYFPLLHACLSSIRDKPEGRDVPLGVLDLGMNDEQCSWLRGVGARIVKPGWDIDLKRAQPLP